MSENTLNVRLKHAAKTEAEWKASNPVLLKGEIAYSTDKRQQKTGDGAGHWADLEYDSAVPTEHEHTGLTPFIKTVGTVNSSLSYFRVARIYLDRLNFKRDDKENNWASWCQHRLTLLAEGRFIGSGLINILVETNGCLDVSDQTTQEGKIKKYCNNNIIVKIILNGVPKEYVKSYAMILDNGDTYVDIWLRHGEWNTTSIYCLGRSDEKAVTLITDFKWMSTITSPDYTYYDTNENIYMYGDNVSTGQIETTGIIPKTNDNSNIGTPDKKWSQIYANTFQGNLNGWARSAGTAEKAAKLTGARNIFADDDYIMSYNFDGSKNVSTLLRAYNATINQSNKNNYPFHRFAKTDVITQDWCDYATTFLITQDYNGGSYGICRISLRTNNQSKNQDASTVSIEWLVRYGFALDSIQAGLYYKDGKTYADVFFKTDGVYAGTVIRNLGSGSRGNINRTWTLINSKEVDNTTTSDKLASTEVYATIAAAGTELHSQAYTTIITSKDVGNTNYSNTSGSSTKATQDSRSQQIDKTYVKNVAANGRTITVTKGDNSTSTFTTQDTTYSNATVNKSGLMSSNDYIDFQSMLEEIKALKKIKDFDGGGADTSTYVDELDGGGAGSSYLLEQTDFVVTLAANKWVQNGSMFTQSVTNSKVSGLNDYLIGSTLTGSESQSVTTSYNTNFAYITTGSSSGSTLTINALKKPTIDLSVRVIKI